MNQSGDNVVTASFSTAANISNSILELLMEANVPAGYGILGCALSLARLTQPTKRMEQNEEIEFVQDIMDWISAYGGAGKERMN